MGVPHDGDQPPTASLTDILLGSMGEGVLGVDAEGRTTFVNQAAEALLGYPAAELIGQPKHDVIHWCGPDGEPHEAGDCAILAVLRDGEERHITGDLFWRKDGSSFPVDLTAAPIRSGSEVVGVAIVFRDVTERMRARRALSEARSRQQALLENLPDAAWLKDTELRYLAVNEAFIRGSGRTREQFLGRTARDVLSPEEAAGYEEGDRRVLEHGETVVREELLPWGRPGDGSMRWIESVKRPLPGPDGNPSGLVGIARDVTERKRREEAEHFLAEAGQVIIASLAWTETLEGVATLVVPDMGDWCAIAALDDGGGVDAVFTRATDAGLADVLRKHAASHPEHWGPENELIGRAIMKGATELYRALSPPEVERLVGGVARFDRAGAAPPRSALVVPMFPKAQARGVMVVVRGPDRPPFDMTDLLLLDQLGQRAALALEHALQHRAAKKAVQARDEVLRVVAHDLRSLVGASGLSAGVLDDAGLTGSYARALERIHDATGRMDRLIQDLLDVSRVEAGWLPLEPDVVEADALLGAAVEAAEAQAEKKKVTLEVDARKGLPALRVDRHRALQVMANLLDNAITYTPAGGRVTVAAEVMRDELLFCVRDTGPGIPESELSHIFDRFRRGSGARGRGTGLGLSIARGIVDAHGGRIWAGGEEGEGARFCFTLPLVEPGGGDGAECPCERGLQEVRQPDPADPAPARILVVDDHDAIRQGVRTILEAEDKVEIVGEAERGEEAVEVARTLKPDVVIMDLSLPGMDGYQAMERIIAEDGDVRILVLTAHAPEMCLLRAMKSGAHGFVRKATAHKELGTALRTVLQGEVFLDSRSNAHLVQALERAGEARRRLAGLTDHEVEILRLTAEGYTAQEIGDRIFLSPHTVASYRSRAMRKLGLEHRADLVHFALETQLIQAE